MSARTDFLLTLDGIKGESGDATHPGSIDVDSFSWGETNATSIGSATGGAGSGKVRFDSLVFTAIVSSASPQLAVACASGHHIPSAVLMVRKAGGKQEEYYKVTFKTVFITQYRSFFVGVGGNENLVIRDEITCVFGEYSIEYRPQTKVGTLDAAIVNGWSQIMNQKA